MIKMAGIVPQQFMGLISQDDMHMALAQLINEEGMEAYTSFYKNGRKNYSYLILDNGAAEGKTMPIEMIVDKAELIRASEIVLPDAYRDARGTLKLHEEAIDYLLQRYDGAENIPFKLMAVPQGSNKEEWIACAKTLLTTYRDIIDTVGIPKHLIDTFENRDGRLEALALLDQETDFNIRDYEIHLLGCWKTPLEVLVVAKAAEQGDIPMVRSCDSAIPYVYARAGLRFDDDDRPDSDPIDFKGGTCDEMQLAINLNDWRNVGSLKANNIFRI